MKICDIEDCNFPVFSKGKCKFHFPRKRTLSKKSVMTQDIKQIDKMNDFFLKIWRNKPHYSEISGIYLGTEPKTYFFHHILEKQSNKEAMYDEDNIILLTFDEHQNIHLNPNRYEEINKRREQLIKKYERTN